MNHRVREINEEWIRPVLADKVHCLGRVTLRERRLIRRIFDDVFAAHQRYRVTNRFGPRLFFSHAFAEYTVLRKASVLNVDRHVVAVRNAEIGIEALPCRQEWLAMAKVPLADADRRITL